MKKGAILCFLFLVLIFSWGNAQEIAPIAVSPGSENGVAVVTQRCPTFSWSSIQWAVGYRVAVFEATTAEVTGYEAMAALATPVLKKEIQGQALSWTPSARDRLRAGGLYVWFVQALDGSGQGVWSAGKVFKVEVEGSVERTEERLAMTEERVGRKLKEAGVSDEVIADVAMEMKSGITGGSLAGDFSLSGAGQTSGKMGTQSYEGSTNTFYGLNAGYTIQYSTGAGLYNTFIGRSAGYANTTGKYSTFLGYYAGRANTTGDGNTFLGFHAGRFNTTGKYNTFLGYAAEFNNTTGYRNTFLGYAAGFNNSIGYGNVFVGLYAGYNEKDSNKLYIDNSISSSPLIYGDFSADYLVFNGNVGVKTTSPTHLLDVGTSGAYCNGGAWVDGSSREYKENIEELSSKEALKAFQELEPVKYNYKADKDEKYLGFIAEDVPELVATKDRKGLSPMDVVAVLTKVVQEQQKMNEAQQKTIDELRKQVAELKRKRKLN